MVYKHLNESPLETLALDVYVSGETNWGNMVHYAHPACVEFFRQAFVYIWHAYRLDGFRFDATEAIVNGHIHNGYILRQPGNGKGWEFLRALRRAVQRAADAKQQPWPYLVAENDPNMRCSTSCVHAVGAARPSSLAEMHRTYASRY